MKSKAQELIEILTPEVAIESSARRTIAIDFDGVINNYLTPGEEIIDDPVPGALNFINEVIKSYNIVVFTARATNTTRSSLIYEWLLKHGFPVNSLTITNVKLIDAYIYIDDRGWAFKGTFPTMDELRTFKPWNR